MKSLSSSILFVCISLQLIVTCSEAISNIQGQGSGFCFKQIPRKSIAGRCSSDDDCRELANHPVHYGSKCGNYGECIVEHQPQNEFCRDACENSPCGKFCLQEHETKHSKYCIKTRDHTNALPPGTPEQNKYHCVCIAPNVLV